MVTHRYLKDQVADAPLSRPQCALQRKCGRRADEIRCAWIRVERHTRPIAQPEAIDRVVCGRRTRVRERYTDSDKFVLRRW